MFLFDSNCHKLLTKSWFHDLNARLTLYKHVNMFLLYKMVEQVHPFTHHLFIPLPTHSFIHKPTHPPTPPSTHPSIHPSFHLSTKHWHFSTSWISDAMRCDAKQCLLAQNGAACYTCPNGQIITFQLWITEPLNMYKFSNVYSCLPRFED